MPSTGAASQTRPSDSDSWLAATRVFLAELAYVLGALTCGALTAIIRNAGEGGGLAWLVTVATAPLVGLAVGAWRRRWNPHSNVFSWMFWSALITLVLNAVDMMGL